MFGFGRKKDKETVDLNGRSETLGIKNKDLLVLGQLMQQGANLREPRHALYYLYLPSRDAAEAGAAMAQTAGYTCDVREPHDNQPSEWPLMCERPDAVLDPPGVIAADNLFQNIADQLGGQFDGWEASARP